MADWMPPLPLPDIASLQKIDNMLGYSATLSYSTAQMRQAQADAARAALEQAARWVRNRADAYDAEHGTTDPATGTREYPGTGDEYMMELAEIEDGIRALAKEIT